MVNRIKRLTYRFVYVITCAFGVAAVLSPVIAVVTAR